MLPGINEGRVRRIGDRSGNGVRSEHSALERIEDPFSGQWFDYASGVADIHQVCALRLNRWPGQRGDRLPTMFGREPELLRRLLPKLFRMLRTADQTQVCQTFSDRGQPEITILAQLKRDMGLGIGRKMSLKANPVRARLRVFPQQPGDGRVASIRGDEESRLDRFVIGGDLPTGAVLNLEHRITESDLGSGRDGMSDQGIIEMFSTDPTLSPGFVRKLESNRAPRQIKELDPAQFGGGQSIDQLADAEAIQDFPGTWVQAISANFLSRKLGSFQDKGRQACARGQSRCGGSGGSGSDDQDVVTESYEELGDGVSDHPALRGQSNV